jgi:uncharacterized protein YbjT (DUF2867 family)
MKMGEEKTILVTGATGRQGGAVARELLARGYRVRAMTRKPRSAKARALGKLGAEVVRGDFDDPTSLAQAVKGAWGAFSVQDSWEAGAEKEEVQGKRFAEICRSEGVQHLVYSSVGSAHRNTGIPHFESKWHIEQTVRSLGFPTHTILRPVFFMENFLRAPLKPGIDEGKLMLALQPTTVLQMIAVEDIGKYGAWAFDDCQRLNGWALDIAGDARTMPETARIIGAAAGREIEFIQIPIEEVRKVSPAYAAMLEWFDAVGYNADIEGLAREAGVRPITLPEWAAAVDWGRRPAAVTAGGRKG